MLQRLKERAGRLKVETFALYLAARDPRTPWYAKLLIMGVVAYALSPVDLIPDFIPVLGYLDDIILIPIGISLALRLVPPTVMSECRAEASRSLEKHVRGTRIAGAVIIAVWLLLAALLIFWVSRKFFLAH